MIDWKEYRTLAAAMSAMVAVVVISALSKPLGISETIAGGAFDALPWIVGAVAGRSGAKAIADAVGDVATAKEGGARVAVRDGGRRPYDPTDAPPAPPHPPRPEGGG